MHWEAIFADMETALAEAEAGEQRHADRERERERTARQRLEERLRELLGGRVDVELVVHGQTMRAHGAAVAQGVGWLLLREPRGDVVVALHSLVGIRSLASAAVHDRERGPAPRGRERLGLPGLARYLARNRREVEIERRNAGSLHGTIDRAGEDFVDIALHEAGMPRRASAVRESCSVPLAEISTIRLATPAPLW